ncbi:MAG: hypothetical protein AB7P02_20515 [Alphaproteobacteria bacterium]
MTDHPVAGLEAHLLARIAGAPRRDKPFPFVRADGVFPDAFYRRLLASLPSGDVLPPLVDSGRVGATYPRERRVLALTPEGMATLPDAERPLWAGLAEILLGRRFLDALSARFRREITERFPDGCVTKVEATYCDDSARYVLEPHTDAPQKLITAIFYLPDAAGQEHLGTTLYAPIDPDFRCPGGPHHDRQLFRPVGTVPYRPNTMFAFVKTDRSFHGVERVADADLYRRVLIVNAYGKAAPRHDDRRAA